MKKVWVLCAVFLAGCALSETERKIEPKVRFDKSYPVELAHYEYEERLQTFYDAEEIASEHLGKLYRGEFPNGETAPNKLRIHWTNARALAQAEVELQKDILGWGGADVSPRPILVNDRDDKFYRYYEYRVLKGGKEVGAVRIPAYRRTENFATAEVHQYNGDASQYTILPSAWFIPWSQKLGFSQSSDFVQELKRQISANLSDQIVEAYAIKNIENNPEWTPKFSAEQRQQISDRFQNYLSQDLEQFRWDSSVSQYLDRILGEERQAVYEGAKRNFFLRNDMQINARIPSVIRILEKNAVSAMAKSEPIKSLVKEFLLQAQISGYLALYADVFQSIMVSLSVANGQPRTIIENIFQENFWDSIEKSIGQGDLRVEQIFQQLDTIAIIAAQKGLLPRLYYPFPASGYQLMSTEGLARAVTPELSLLIKNHGEISLSQPQNAFSRMRSSRSIITREQYIRDLNDLIAININKSAMAVNETTQKMSDNYKKALFSWISGDWSGDSLENGLLEINIPVSIGSDGVSIASGNVVYPSGMQIDLGYTNFPSFPKPSLTVKPGYTPPSNKDRVVGALTYAGKTLGTMAITALIKGSVATLGVLSTAGIGAGILGGIAIIALAARAAVLIDRIANKAKEVRNEQINILMTEFMDGSLKYVLEKAQKDFIANGWEPLSKEDGYNIGFALDYFNASNASQKRNLMENRVLQQIAITGDTWYIPGMWNGNLYHWSFGSSGHGNFTPIPIGAITVSRAYVTKTVKRKLDEDWKAKSPYLNFLKNNGYTWEYNEIVKQYGL